MATEKTDVVIVGMGAAGGVLAAELGPSAPSPTTRASTRRDDEHQSLR